MAIPKTDKDTQTIPMHAEGGRFPGFGGLNTEQRDVFVMPWEGADCLNWFNRSGLAADNIGALSTRPGYADGPKYEMVGGVQDTATLFGPIRMMHKFYPDSSVAGTGVQVLELVQNASGANKSIYRKWDGATWATVTASGYTNGTLGNTYYPQCMVMGLPTPKFCWIDLENGLHVYDGTTDTKQAIPKYADGTANITGAMWLEQMDGRVIVAGNWVDAGESNVVYFSGPNDTTAWTNTGGLLGGGGSFVVYAADRTSGNSAPKRITGMASMHGQLIVFTEDMRYVCSGVGTAYLSVKEYPGAGCFSGKTIVKYDDKLYWWGKDGAYVWDGNRVTKLSNRIWNKVANLELLSGYKWFSFVFKDQWWTCVKYRDSGTNGILSSTTGNYYYNWIYDFKTGEWYVGDIPMVAAFSSHGGLDLGGLFFSSPLDTGTNAYKTYRYGLDDVDSPASAVNSDNGADIVATWETCKWDGTNPTVGMSRNPLTTKMWEKFRLKIELGILGNFDTGYARLQYRLNDTAAYSNLTMDTTTSPLPVIQHLYFPVGSYGHFMQARFTVSGTKRVDVLMLYADYKDTGMSEAFG